MSFTCIREISINIDCQPDRTGMASLVTILLPCLEFPGLLNRIIDPGKLCMEVLLTPPQLPKSKKLLKSATSAKRP